MITITDRDSKGRIKVAILDRHQVSFIRDKSGITADCVDMDSGAPCRNVIHILSVLREFEPRLQVFPGKKQAAMNGNTPVRLQLGSRVYYLVKT